jgi:signal transduction histidine kinase
LEGQYAGITWVLTRVIFFAFFHTQLLYHFTIDREWAEMHLLSEKLSRWKDKKLLADLNLFKKRQVPFPEIKKIHQAWEDGDLSRMEYQVKLEEFLNLSPYVSAYYRPVYLPNETADRSIKKDGFFIPATGEPGYSLFAGDGASIRFNLKAEESKRLHHLIAGNYRGMEQLNDYEVFIYYKNRLLFRKGEEPPRSLSLVESQESHSGTKTISSKEMRYISAQASGFRVVLIKRLGGYAKPLAFFSFTTILGLLLYYCYAVGTHLRKDQSPISPSIQYKSLGRRIQRTLIYVTFCSFCILCLTSLFYFDKSRKQENERRKWTLARDIITTFQGRFHGSQQQLSSISRQYGFDLLYEDTDKNIYKSFRHSIPGGTSQSSRYGFNRVRREEIVWKGKELLRIWYPVPHHQNIGVSARLGIYFPNDEKEMNNDAIDFIGALFSGYLFLLLSISAISIYITQSLTHPLDQLGKHLSNLKIDTGEKIRWHKNDEVGQLVIAYNTAIDALWESTEKLRKTEREVAWREMAKQVAHEIKNPLTPMKLSLQYLQRAGKYQPELIHTLLPNLTVTLMEQIHTLDVIATAFSQFASMPGPEKGIFNLVELVEETIEIYRHREEQTLHLSCTFQEQNYPIFADRQQIQRVVNNLVTNAIQAIPAQEAGRIHIRIFQADPKRVRLEIEDNGEGVSPETRPNIFSPYFTTKSSGTGLGLAMCRDIIEGSGGVIGFETTRDEKTVFWIEMPLSIQDHAPTDQISSMAYAS